MLSVMRMFLLLAAVLSSMALAGCSPAAAPGDDAEAGADPTATATPTPDPTAVPKPAATATPTPEAAAGDTFRVGDCWGGVLGNAPLHCYVLEQAQMAGEIDVESIYEAPNNVLHIFLRGSEPLDEELARLFQEKAYEFLDSPQGSDHPFDSPYLDPYVDPNVDICLKIESRSRERRVCMLGDLDFWTSPRYYRTGKLVPPAASHDQIYLRPGGADARRSIVGWPSWWQVWPVLETQPVTRDSSTFDVSDVDTGKIPDPDCEQHWSSACRIWKRAPETGIAGYFGWEGTHYIQVKGPLPQDEAGLEALKRKLVPPSDHIKWAASYHCYENFDEDGLCTYTHTDGRVAVCSEATNRCTHEEDGGLLVSTAIVRPPEYELIPVSYDYGEMWRWSVILNRFALSEGNTIGITQVWVDTNIEWNETVFRSGLQKREGPSTIRDTVVVVGLDARMIVDALPRLLPLLGIPVDAVGVVHSEVERPIVIKILE